METKKQLLLKGVVGILGAIALVGCGGNPYHEASMDPGHLTPGQIPNPTYTIPPVTAPTGSGSLLPPLSYSFTISGASGSNWSTTVNTDNLLKVRLRFGAAGKITVPNSNFSGVYSCISYRVTVLGQESPRVILAGSGGGQNCPGAPQETIIDFSNRLTPGHGPVTIVVDQPLYDFYLSGCLSNPIAYGVYSPLSCYYLYSNQHTVYQTHTITGAMDIQINGTSL